MMKHNILSIDFIKFIPKHNNDKFLEPVVAQILKLVKTIPIIRTRSGGWVEPPRACVVPHQLLYNNESLFSESELASCKGYHSVEYAHPAYTASHTQSLLIKLGCLSLDSTIVAAIISSQKFRFQKKGYGWLAVLFRYIFDNSMDNCDQYCFLQLADSSWTSLAQSRPVYLPLSSQLEDEVKGLDISSLHGEFYLGVTHIPTAQLFLTRTLKIAGLSELDIVRAIVKAHSQAGRTSLTASECIKHATSLARRRHMLNGSARRGIKQSFYIVDQDGDISNLHKKFVRDRQMQTTPRVWLSGVRNANSFRILSEDYEDHVEGFLVEHLGIDSFLPPTEEVSVLKKRKKRWIEDTQAFPSKCYTETLCPLTQNSNILLWYLAEIWSEFMRAPGFFDLKPALLEMHFYCENGSHHPLSSCFLQTKHMKSLLSPDMNILKIEQPDHPKWLFLTELGVALEPNLNLFIEDLRHKKSKVYSDDDVFYKIDWLYKDLALHCQGNLDNSSLR
jgi:hypothetical protein